MDPAEQAGILEAVRKLGRPMTAGLPRSNDTHFGGVFLALYNYWNSSNGRGAPPPPGAILGTSTTAHHLRSCSRIILRSGLFSLVYKFRLSSQYMHDKKL